MAKGLYRFTKQNGGKWAVTDQPPGPEITQLYTKDTYETLGYQPPFEKLPLRSEDGQPTNA